MMGRITALLVQVWRVTYAGQDLLDVMDGESSEIGKHYGTFFKSDDYDYKNNIGQQFVNISR